MRKAFSVGELFILVIVLSIVFTAYYNNKSVFDVSDKDVTTLVKKIVPEAQSDNTFDMLHSEIEELKSEVNYLRNINLELIKECNENKFSSLRNQ